MRWSEPQTPRQWAQRAFSWRPLLLVLFFGLLFLTELRFDWMEQAAGAYLQSTNFLRPESGTVWERGRRNAELHRNLEKIVTDRRNLQRSARGAIQFGRLTAGMAAGDEVMLSSSDFLSFYRRLPPLEASEAIDPYTLLELSSGGHWKRTYLERTAGGLRVYLLDEKNQVLYALEIEERLMKQLEDGSFLTNDPEYFQKRFGPRVYPAASFFKALASLPSDVRPEAVPSPETLLKIRGSILRVGIGDEVSAGAVMLAFEIQSENRRQVMTLYGRDWAISQLYARLHAEEPSVASMAPGRE